MSNLTAQIKELAAILGSAEQVVQKFQALRDACSDEQFEQLHEIKHLGDLLSSLSDLEYDMEKK